MEPPPSPWNFAPAAPVDDSGLVGVGADLAPGSVLAAYRSGMFPMPLEPGGRMGWWSPDPRGVLPLDRLRVSRSLQRSMRGFRFSINTAFVDVIDECADPRRPHGWIDGQIRAAYLELHRLGWVHSVETWQGGRLVGGLYGVSIGGLFAGESMFHRATDASKAALVHLAETLSDGGNRLIDVQWRTDHLATLGVVEWSRDAYMAALPGLLATPMAAAFCEGPHTIREA